LPEIRKFIEVFYVDLFGTAIMFDYLETFSIKVMTIEKRQSINAF